jgi:hypothetical protein
MVKRSRKDIEKEPANQGAERVISAPNKIGASTRYDPVTFCYTSLNL